MQILLSDVREIRRENILMIIMHLFKNTSTAMPNASSMSISLHLMGTMTSTMGPKIYSGRI